MSADSAVTYTSVHSEARSWSIPFEDPYEEAARQLQEQAPHSPEYVPDPMELEDYNQWSEKDSQNYYGPWSRLQCSVTLWENQFRDTKRRMMTHLRDGNMRGHCESLRCEVIEEKRLCLRAREYWRPVQPCTRSEAYCRALEARVTVLETEVHRHEWQRQAADDLAVQHIMRTQALEAGARVDTLEDTVDISSLCDKMAPKRATRSTPVTTTPAPIATTTTTVTNAQLQAMIDQGVSAALAAHDANRNGVDNHTSGTGVRGSERVAFPKEKRGVGHLPGFHEVKTSVFQGH
ncbi:hypothetical protein Tco_0746549 [Tanacetum coccineum]